MGKLWDKGISVDKAVEAFTVGDDYLLDSQLVKWDVVGSIAHASMLSKIGILSSKEKISLIKNLKKIISLKDKFSIKQSDEDVHTAVEQFLTKQLGEVGKKIHTGRSRNDQILVDIRLYSKDQLIMVIEKLLSLAGSLASFADKHKSIPLPGYTHTRKAMPSSVGLWAGAFSESLLDDLLLLKTAYKLNNQCPLGSAASYGVPLAIDRQYVSTLLGFAKVQNNTLYAGNSRGKFESVILNGLLQVMFDLGKMASDLILFSEDTFGYFSLPEQFCTGSSIMPQKKNPDVLELVRAKQHVVESNLFQVNSIIKNLISGYHRDFQLTKKPLMEGLQITISSLSIMELIIKHLKINKEKCVAGCTPELFATDYALQLVKEGAAFRDAYKVVGKNLHGLKSINAVKRIDKQKHVGGTGNLGLGHLKNTIKKESLLISQEKDKFRKIINKLLV